MSWWEKRQILAMAGWFGAGVEERLLKAVVIRREVVPHRDADGIVHLNGVYLEGRVALDGQKSRKPLLRTRAGTDRREKSHLGLFGRPENRVRPGLDIHAGCEPALDHPNPPPAAGDLVGHRAVRCRRRVIVVRRFTSCKKNKKTKQKTNQNKKNRSLGHF